MKSFFTTQTYFTLRFFISFSVILFLYGSAPSQISLDDIEKIQNKIKNAKLSSFEGPSGACPQSRHTHKVPNSIYIKKNPLEATEENLFIGQLLYNVVRHPLACKDCHGEKGNGNGAKWGGLDTPPRNFTCGITMDEIPDGQLFGIIRHGSPGTQMTAYDLLEDNEIWQLVLYIRQFAR